MEQLSVDSSGNRKRSVLSIFLIVIVILLLIAVLLYALLAPAISNVFEDILEEGTVAGDAFMQALKDAEYDKAYGLLHPELQQQLGGPDTLESNFPASLIESWEYEAEAVAGEDGESAVRLVGVLNLTDGSQLDMQLVTNWDGDEGQVAGYSFQAR